MRKRRISTPDPPSNRFVAMRYHREKELEDWPACSAEKRTGQ